MKYSSIVFILLLASSSTAEPVCLLYFTGVGCPHCARADPVVLGGLPLEFDVVVIEYEIWDRPENRMVMDEYRVLSWADQGVPELVYGPGDFMVGDRKILKLLPGLMEELVLKSRGCLLLNGSTYFGDVNLSALHGRPTIWFRDRVLVKEENYSGNDTLIKSIFLADDPSFVLAGRSDVEWVSPKHVGLSGGQIVFPAAVRVGGWLFQWNNGVSRSVDDRFEWTSYFTYFVIIMEPLMKYLLGFALLVYVLILVQEKRIAKRRCK